jgi:hypothetical protein
MREADQYRGFLEWEREGSERVFDFLDIAISWILRCTL